MSSQGKSVLGYWKLRGLGHPIRFLLRYLEVDFEDKMYEYTPEHTTDNWLAERDTLNLDFPNLPYLLDGSNRLTEMRAIMKYLCRTRNPALLGKTPEIQTSLDTLDYFIYDFWYVGFIPVIYEYTEELHHNFKHVLQPTKLGYLSKFLKNKKWLAGEDISYVDFFLYELIYQFTVLDSTSLDNFENLKAYKARFEELPAIKKYINSPEFLKAPCSAPMAILKI